MGDRETPSSSASPEPRQRRPSWDRAHRTSHTPHTGRGFSISSSRLPSSDLMARCQLILPLSFADSVSARRFICFVIGKQCFMAQTPFFFSLKRYTFVTRSSGVHISIKLPASIRRHVCVQLSYGIYRSFNVSVTSSQRRCPPASKRVWAKVYGLIMLYTERRSSPLLALAVCASSMSWAIVVAWFLTPFHRYRQRIGASSDPSETDVMGVPYFLFLAARSGP